MGCPWSSNNKAKSDVADKALEGDCVDTFDCIGFEHAVRDVLLDEKKEEEGQGKGEVAAVSCDREAAIGSHKGNDGDPADVCVDCELGLFCVLARTGAVADFNRSEYRRS